MIALRVYQTQAVDAARAHYRSGVRSVLLVAPTGAGKGTIAASLLTAVAGRSRRGLFIVHRAELVRDQAARLARAGVGRVATLMGAESMPDADAAVHACTVQTLFARGTRPPADLVIWDEAHHATCDTYRSVREAYPDALHLGLTATPERADGTPLGDVFERLVVAASHAELVALNRRDPTQGLVPCDVVAPPARQQGLAEDPVRAYLERGRATDGTLRRAIFFGSSRSHAQQLAVRLVAMGVRAACVESGMTAGDRRATIARFASGEIECLTNVAILTEGYDDPSVEVVVHASGVSHAGAWLQKCGRALRPSPSTGKQRALVLDLTGAVYDFGLPDAPREYSLTGDAIRLPGALAEGEEPLALRQCAACGLVAEAPDFRDSTCPRCGATKAGRPDPRVRRAQLAAVHAAHAPDKRVLKLRELTVIAQARGYKPTWAAIQFKVRYQRFPTSEERAAAGLVQEARSA